MSETTYLPEGASPSGPGMHDAGHGVSYTPYYADEECTQLVGLWMWHPCPLTRERLGTDVSVGPNARTGTAWGYENTADPERITLIGSVLDPECGWHGFVRDGRWVPC
ncbi:hypothetical protein SEA_RAYTHEFIREFLY_36 [Gordonia phage RayTheFireFly]|nr:hypothetical protein SEA_RAYTHEFIREFLY_36 [Gordonia phage RayTheFireFly]